MMVSNAAMKTLQELTEYRLKQELLVSNPYMAKVLRPRKRK